MCSELAMDKPKQRRPKRFYTQDEIDFIRENVKGSTLRELTKRFNDKFGLNISEVSMARRKSKYGLRSNYNAGWFTSESTRGNKSAKGHKPTNGFKIGHLPHTAKPIGAEKIDKDGFIKIKTAQPNIWKLKHHVIYENAYGEKVKSDEKIVFLDGNKRNFKIDNLIKISQTEQMLLAKINTKSNNPEIRKTQINIAKIKAKVIKISEKK